jgi:hypothetical protein
VIVGFNLGMLVEGSVAILLAVTIGYCAILNQRLKRLHSDRETLAKMVGDLVQATGLANSAITELKTAALEADAKLSDRLDQAEKFESELSTQVANGAQLIEKIARITAAARSQPLPGAPEHKPEPAKPAIALEPQSKLHSALQQLAMRPGIGGKAA